MHTHTATHASYTQALPPSVRPSLYSLYLQELWSRSVTCVPIPCMLSTDRSPDSASDRLGSGISVNSSSSPSSPSRPSPHSPAPSSAASGPPSSSAGNLCCSRHLIGTVTRVAADGGVSAALLVSSTWICRPLKVTPNARVSSRTRSHVRVTLSGATTIISHPHPSPGRRVICSCLSLPSPCGTAISTALGMVVVPLSSSSTDMTLAALSG
mmetsp:Transcript_36793/g.92193  ORF Transcript_36793/g.92193 Transcript_36793/m.92193 type:complete len:211 (+) Transcript_36793:1081-1713(+)